MSEPEVRAVSQGRRMDVAVALAVAAASIVAAIHRGPRPAPTCTPNYSISLQPWIVLVGFIVAGLIVAVGTHVYRSRR